MSTTITGNESFWGSVKLSAGALALINKSPTLVNQLQQYGNAVADHTTSPMQIGTGNGTFYDSASNQVVFAGNYQNWTDSITVGNLAHEIGHYVNSANDRAFAIQHQTALGDPNAYSMDAMIGLHREGEAVDNNYIVQQEIKQNGGGLVYLAGQARADGSTTALQSLLDTQHSADVKAGCSASIDQQFMIEQAMGVYSTPSTSNTQQNYFDYYGSSRGAHSPAPGAATGFSIVDPNGNGNYTSMKETFSSGDTVTQQFSGTALSSAVTADQFGNVLTQTLYSHNTDGSYVANIYDGQGHATAQNQFHSDGSQVDYVFNANGTQNATVLNAAGRETEYATFASTGAKTQDLLYDATSGRLTRENDFNADGSQVDHIFNTNGTQNTAVFNAAGHETEYATFGTNGKMAQDQFYDASSGRLTRENDFNADGSQVDHIFNTNGTQTAYAFNAAGHETEQSTFGTNGKITQDVFFDATTGRETRENDFNADGSQVDHIFNANGTQTASTFNAASHETEQATFGINGAKTQDLFYDATSGRLTQENDFNADGSQVDHIFNTNGTQTAYAFNAAGHETEQATFGANGKITQDLVFDGSTGRELQETDYNANGSGVAHIFNPDGTQTAAVFDPSGHVSEYATYGTNGKVKTDAFFDPNGRETQLNEYSGNQTTVHIINADNTQTATVYNGANQETEFARFDARGHKTDDYFFNGPTGRETEYDHYGSDGSMVANIFHSDNSQDLIIYNASGQETQYDAYNSQGQLTGFTNFTYTVGGGYNAVAYGPTGYESGWADYASNGTQISTSGGAYNFTLDDGYECGADWGFTTNLGGTGYSSDYGFYI
ncbi:hypothetical protein [Paraburkholderia aromaticivorans]|uniref:hypothetical protein n=1 Tax=Paraburkholderia aromaticivorans TaxID=2026199 RepID=UPI0014560A05|nr:hypothetical protein [Paraburkholderia aromaticivorans]